MLLNVVDVTAITGQKVTGSLTSWQTPNGPYNVEHLAGMSPAGDLLVFWWSPQHDWQSVNVSGTAGESGALKPASYQLPDGQENVEVLCSKNPMHSLLVFWWKPSLDWQVMDLTDITGRSIYSAPESWLTPDGNRGSGSKRTSINARNESLSVYMFSTASTGRFISLKTCVEKDDLSTLSCSDAYPRIDSTGRFPC